MQPLQLDDSFLADLGLGDLPEDQKRAFLGHVMETLQYRVGTKLSQGLSEAQLTEFEQLSPTPEDAPEAAASKQQQALTWLETNRPDYKDVVAEEIEALKGEILKNANTILGSTAQKADN